MAENNTKSDGLEVLKKQFEKIHSEILDKKRKAESGAQGTDTEAARKSLSSLYIKASGIAKNIALKCTNEDEKKAWEKNAALLWAKIDDYGSIIKKMQPKTTLDDIKGQDDVKEIVRSFIWMINHPEVPAHYKIESGMGLLMYGPPGTGKTMFAEAIANATGLPLAIVTPSNIFKSYVGESEAAVKQIFEDIDSCADGAVLFVDECESIFSKRTNRTEDYKRAVTNELLQAMNGMSEEKDSGRKRILIAATNRPDQIDEAYLRYKRFSHQVYITPPDEDAINAIIEAKLSGIELANDVALDHVYSLAKQSNGINGAYYSAADICGIMEDTCRLAIEQIMHSEDPACIPLTRQMFDNAFSRKAPSISSRVLEFFEKFGTEDQIRYPLDF